VAWKVETSPAAAALFALRGACSSDFNPSVVRYTAPTGSQMNFIICIYRDRMKNNVITEEIHATSTQRTFHGAFDAVRKFRPQSTPPLW
jgi:hypothetical protein